MFFPNSVRYRSLRFGTRSIQQMLTRHTDQIITGNIKIHGNVFVTNNTGVSIRHLTTANNVFGVALDSLLDDCVQHMAKEPVHLAADKFVNQMYVGHLVVETDFWQTGQPNGPERSTAAIKTLYKSLRDGITLDGESDVLRNQFVIDQMDVTDTINGMPSATFGQEWLLIERDQVRVSRCPIPQLFFIYRFFPLPNSDVFGGPNVRQCKHRRRRHFVWLHQRLQFARTLS